MSEIEIAFNGQSKHVPVGTTVAELLLELELDAKRVAVELNLEVVPRQQHQQCVLKAGDQLEVVTFVGGG